LLFLFSRIVELLNIDRNPVLLLPMVLEIVQRLQFFWAVGTTINVRLAVELQAVMLHTFEFLKAKIAERAGESRGENDWN
jgi:hypothetical protein